jgi:hypothetical protein
MPKACVSGKKRPPTAGTEVLWLGHVNRSASRFDASFARAFPTALLLALGTTGFVGFSGRRGQLSLSRRPCQCISYPNPPLFRGFQQARVLAYFQWTKFFSQLFGELLDPTSDSIATFHPWSPAFASFLLTRLPPSKKTAQQHDDFPALRKVRSAPLG